MSAKRDDDLSDLSHKMLTFTLRRGELAASLTARTGQLTLHGRPTLSTPSFIACASRGVVPHLTQDVLQKHTSISAVYMGLEDFIEKTPHKAPVFKTPHTSPDDSILRSYVSLPDSCLAILGTRRIPRVPCPQQNTDSSLSISTSVGFAQLEVEQYHSAAKQLQPDVVTGVVDLVDADRISRKRIERSADRTHAWLRDVLRDQEGTDDDDDGTTPLFASVPPFEPEQQSFYLSDLVNEYQDRLAGLCLYSPNTVGDLPEQLRHLPTLCIHEPRCPQDILTAISLGNDLVTVPFVTAVSEGGIALDFLFPKPPQTDQESTLQPLGMDMWSTVHATDVRALVPACECYACTRHHRAYLHHLLQAREMLAWTLLQVHNFHVINNFFAAIRSSIDAGSFDEDSKTFRSNYEAELPAQSGEGPRVRGYQMRSVGGGEPKKNRKAYGLLDEQARKMEEAESGIATPTLDQDADALAQQGFAEKSK